MLRFLIRYLLLTAAFALATMGLLGWQSSGFEHASALPWHAEFWMRGPHPLHLLVLGIALLPPTLLELFELEYRRSADDHE